MKYNLIVAVIISIIIAGVIMLVNSYKPTPTNVPQTVVLEGHDYFLTVTYGGYYTLCHKGNCSACIKGEK